MAHALWDRGRRHIAFGLGAAGLVWLSAQAAYAPAGSGVDAYGERTAKNGACAETISPQSTQKVPVPVPITAPPTSASPPSRATPARNRVPTESDFRGPREAWQRLQQALKRGDRDGAMKELTPAAQQRLKEAIDTLSAKSHRADVEQWGPVRSITLTGDNTATVNLSRKKADGTYAYEVMMMRGADGKWRIDNM